MGSLALGPALVKPIIKGRFGTRWNDRLGYTLCGGGQPIWLHGASVGEVGSNLALLSAIRALGYQGQALLTSATPAGLDYLENHLPKWSSEKSGPHLSHTQIAAPPLDFLGAPGRFLDRLAPRALLVIETEIWPELFFQCHKRSIPVFLLSARLSQRSYQRLSMFQGFINRILKTIALAATISQSDCSRLVDLGVSPDKTVVIGSPKFDRLIALAKERLSNLSQKFNLDLADQNNWAKLDLTPIKSKKPLILAGSTHPGEEELILSKVLALKESTAALALAPRHLERVPQIMELIKAYGLLPLRFSENSSLRGPADSVVVIDQIGQLSSLYQECDLAIVGGSFFDGAGHNPLEPVAAGKPVIFGPNMSSFKAEADDLESLGAAWAAPKDILLTAINRCLSQPELAFKAGLIGLNYLAGKRAVAPILAQAVLNFLSEPSPLGQKKALDYLFNQALQAEQESALGQTLDSPSRSDRTVDLQTLDP
jgi:3-deoxy-D-manno-octulosonic-acid transferase